MQTERRTWGDTVTRSIYMVLEMNAHKNRDRARIMCVSPAGESGKREENTRARL
jgi:hypothetical protein